ncbi:type I restriction enzyme HsdR N-terminal domain-containing protein [Desulfatitalea tepidiphila]|uniref:type I restriction enzyme HsdR N-terminal domain-containing protein n=1 Tax=Desulfatitalea tepidiphila TaxID=1185843 RepID=UPI0006B43BC9|nr:type I restriction enzyme HsdR N-terminal domain-containing protein [Desulfatitalea tepidiphila]
MSENYKQIINSEKWNEICFLLSENIRQTLPEKDFENQVVRAIEVLGWKEFRNEIERQPSIQLGREGTLRPDLIIYGKNKKCLIVVEVKRPLEDIKRDYIIGQLRSYMRQMKSDFGFLIGPDLRVFYDGPLNPHSDPILLEKIDFEKQSEDGIKFVSIFNKSGLESNEYDEYLNNKLHKFNKKQQVRAVTQQLISFELKQRVVGFLRNEFPDTDDETFSEALQQVYITISKKEEIGQKIPLNTTGGARTRESTKKITRSQPQNTILKSSEDSPASHKIATTPFESRLLIRLKHIYGVLYFMKQGSDFPTATHQTLKLFPEVQDYQTISDKCARGFAGDVDTFISWFNSGQMLNKLQLKFNLSDHDYNIFKELLG